jgi:hypothetical protein
MANITTSSPRRAFCLSEDTRVPNPLCFVLMPFGCKSSPLGGIIDFDAVHLQIITPAIVAAALDPIRADEEQGGGIIHKPMFEWLILCEYAVGRISRRPTPLAGTVLVQEQLVLALNRAG